MLWHGMGLDSTGLLGMFRCMAFGFLQRQQLLSIHVN
jgi:hypothetical protein